MIVDQLGLSRLTVFAADRIELLADHCLDLFLRAEQLFQLRNFPFQTLGLLQTVEQKFLVDVAQPDFCHILCLHLIDAEADHEVRNDLGVELCFADDADCLVDIEQDLAQTFEKMQLVLFLLQLEIDPPADALAAPRGPLLENLAHTQHARHAADQNVEVAAERVLQRRRFEELLHELFGVRAAF